MLPSVCFAQTDTLPPTLTLLTLNNFGYKRGVIPLSATATDSQSGLASISFYSSGALLGSSTSSPCDINWNSAATKANGVVEITAIATDKEGNVAQASLEKIKIDNFRPITFAPRKAVTNNKKVAKLYWKVFDPFTGNRAYVVIRIRKGKKLVKSIKLDKNIYATINKTNSFKYAFKLPAGKYRFYVYATDQAGNTQGNVASNTLVVN